MELDSIRPPDGYLGLHIQARTPVSAAALARVFADLPQHAANFPRVVSEARAISCAGETLMMSYTSLFRPKTGGIDTVKSINRMQMERRPATIAYRWKSDRVTNAYIDAVWGAMIFTEITDARGNYTLIDYVSGVHPQNRLKRIAVRSHRDRLADDAEYFVKQLIDRASKAKQSGLSLFPCDT